MPWVVSNDYLTQSEMEENAPLIYAELTIYGFSFNAICAIIGNMQRESTLNPGLWQKGSPPYGEKTGYGLTQWTPYTKYSEWAGAGWEGNGPKECERINFEFDNGIQFLPSEYSSMRGTEFKTSDKTVAELAVIFLHNYERPADQSKEEEDLRISYANAWYEFLSGMPPIIPIVTRKHKWWIFGRTGGI